MTSVQAKDVNKYIHVGPQGTRTYEIPVAADYSDEHILVKFKSNVSESYRAEMHRKANARLVRHYKTPGLYKVKTAGSKNKIVEAINAYLKDDNVEYAEPDYIIHTTLIPNDPGFSQLWGLHNTGQAGGASDSDIDAPEAWELTTGGNVVVAVIDTGVNYNHQDLSVNMWVNAGEIPNNGIDDDGNGYIDDYRGWNFIANSNDPMDNNKHGTHCAGTIAGVGNNGIGIAGVNWNAKIMPLKFLDANGSGYTSDAVEAVIYAKDMGVRIISGSWGSYSYSQTLRDAIEVLNEAGGLFIAAAGNDVNNNDSSQFYPASYDLANIISVAATDRNDLLASFSNYGTTSVDIAAPGVDIYSTAINGYETLSGTSMAAPHVAGVAALALGKNEGITNNQLKNLILMNTDTKPSLSGKVATGGRLNAKKVVDALSLPAYIISGRVTSSGVGLQGVSINLDGMSSGSITTDVNGNFIFSFVADGTYTVTPVKPGYTFSPASRDITISGSDATEMDFTASSLPVDEGFETGDFTKFLWKMGGNANWTVQSVVRLSGVYAAEAPGALNDRGNSYIEVTLDVTAAGYVKFRYKVSSEEGYDFLRFNIDGEEKGKWSSAVDWTEASYEVIPGLHTFKWEYTKDSSVSKGRDTAWIDDITFPPFLRQPRIDVAPETIDFGRVNAGTVSSPQTVTISNKGTAVLNVAAVSISGDSASEFSKQSDGCSGLSLAIGSSCTVQALLTPTSSGDKAAVLQVQSDDPGAGNVSIFLTGIGIDVSDTKPNITVIPPSIDFGDVNITTTVDRTVTVRNDGNAVLLVGQIAPSSSYFSIFSDTCSNTTLAPLADCALILRFAPFSGGKFNGSLEIPSNDPLENTVTINLKGNGWVVSTIDQSNDVGYFTSIATDSNNKVHISYAKRNRYYGGDLYELFYMTNASGSWSKSYIDSSGDAGQYSSIAVDSNNKVHISYYDGYPNYNLKYATNASGSWVTTIVDDSAGVVGKYTSIALDHNNKAHISYYYDNHEYVAYLKYATNASGSWVTTTVDNSIQVAAGNSSIAVDSNNKIHISYCKGTEVPPLFTPVPIELLYTTNASGSWIKYSIDSEGYVGSNSSIAVDANNKVHISYSDGADYQLKYAGNASGRWERSAIGATGNVASYTSIAVDPYNKVYISYFDYTNKDLKFATNSSGVWTSSTIDSSEDVGRYCSIALDGNNAVHISSLYYDTRNSSGALRYATNADNSPPTGFVSINNGASYTNSPSVTLNLSASDPAGVSQMCISNYTSCSAWEDYATTKTWALILGDGTRTVYAWFRDGKGNVSNSYSDTIVLDTAVPTGTITINNGSAYTTQTLVSLTLSASDTGSGVFQMRFSNDNTTWSAWETYASSKGWNVDSGDGQKNVYVQFKDAIGNISSSYSDNIILDTADPTGTITINNGSAYTNQTSVTLTLSASDTGSGVFQMRFSNDNTTWSTWETYASSKTWNIDAGDGEKTVYVQYQDNVYNISAAFSDAIILDTANTFTITASKTGAGTGTIISSPTGINCGGVCSENYHVGSVVTLDAIPDAGSTFTGWSGSCSGTCVCSLTSDSTASANFEVTIPSSDNWTIEVAENGTSSTGFANSLTVDSNGKAHIVYDNKYLTNSTGSWTLSTFDSQAQWPSIAVDSTNKMHISYYDPFYGDLKYSTNAAGAWVATVVDSAGSVGGNTSIAIDSTDSIHISYYDYTNGDLKYATNASGNWITSTIDSAGYVGGYTSIAIDGNNNVHISYYDNSNQNLKYATNSSGLWVTSTIDSSGDVGMYNSITADKNNKIHISYIDYEPNYRLKYATNISGSWVTSTVDSTIYAGWWRTSIAVDSYNKAHISFHNFGSRDLMYTTNESGVWVTSTIDLAGDVGYDTSMKIDSNNKIHIAYQDYTNYDLKYATKTVKGVPSALTVIKSGTGSGHVLSSPSGVDCGADCSESYDAGTLVTLTATPDAGSTFTGWSSDCSGTCPCIVRMNAVKSVTATFNGNPNIEVNPASFDFNNVNLGTYSENTFTVNNTGTTALLIGTLSSPGAPFGITTDNCSDVTIQPGGTCTLTVRFYPVTTGSFNSSLSIPSNDPDGNPITLNLSGTGVDLDPPTGSVSINDNAIYTNSASVTLALSATDESGVSYMCISNTTSCNSWEAYNSTKEWILETGDGAKTVSVWLKDAAGNISTNPNSATIIFDNTFPNGTIIINSGAVCTNSTEATLTLSCSDINGCSEMQFSNNGINYSTPADSYLNSKIWTIDTLSGDGTKTVYVKFKDTAGNWSNAYSDTIVLDVMHPVLTLSTLSDGSWTNSDTLNISGTATDNMGIPALTINGTPVTVNPDGTFSDAVTLIYGPNSINTIAYDLAGNETTDIRTINFDPTAPHIEIKIPADNSKTKQISIPVTGTVDESSVVKVKVNSNNPLPAQMNGNDYALDITLAYGINTIEVTATDLAENTSSAKRTVTYDNQNPDLSVTEPNQDVRTNQSSVLLKGQVSDLTEITVTVTKDEENYTPSVTNGQFEQTITFTEEKTYAIYVTAADEVGNTSIVQRNIIYDKTPPPLTLDPVTTPTNQSSQILSGSMEEWATVQVECPTASVGTVTYPTATAWTVSLTNMAEGNNDITVTASDETGNASDTITATIVVDTIPRNYYCDKDSDGHINAIIDGTCTGFACQSLGCQTTQGDDCDDNDAAIHPWATELCDNKDNDCNPNTPDGSGEVWYGQQTSCGLGVCGNTGQYICLNGIKTNTCTPGNITGDDSNCNGIDENCDGVTDNNFISTFNNCGTGVCTATGQINCVNGAPSNTCTPGMPAQIPEADCSDGLDNDCDGYTDCDDTDCAAQCQTVPPGDCNGDNTVDAGDISALVLEIFDGDGSNANNVPGGTFPGNPYGSDPNGDGKVDAGDIACTVLIIFNGPEACGN